MISEKSVIKFWNKVSKTNSCWLWIGQKNNFGYGRFHYTVSQGVYKRIVAHRFSYELENGKILDDLTLDHICRVRNCVNPLHLEAVSMKENILRGIGKPAINKRKTHCDNGHEFNSENTRIVTVKVNGKFYITRMCVECKRKRARDWAFKNYHYCKMTRGK